MKKDISKVKSIIEKYDLDFNNDKEIIKWMNKLNDVEYNEIALLSLCDRLGRGEMDFETIESEKNRIENFKEYFAHRD